MIAFVWKSLSEAFQDNELFNDDDDDADADDDDDDDDDDSKPDSNKTSSKESTSDEDDKTEKKYKGSSESDDDSENGVPEAEIVQNLTNAIHNENEEDEIGEDENSLSITDPKRRRSNSSNDAPTRHSKRINFGKKITEV